MRMNIVPEIRTLQLETGVTNMLRVRNIVVSFLLCLHIVSYEALAYSIKAEEYVTEDDAYVNPVINWKCESNLDCSVIASSCVDGLCQCRDGYIYNNNMTSCIKVATTYGDACEESIQCSRYLLSGGICTNATCVCAEGYYYMHGRCNAYAGLFGKCHKDDDCYVNGDFDATSCINGMCKCSPGFYQREYRTCRPEAKGVGEKCVIDNDCKRFDNTAYCNFENVCLLPDTDSSASEYLYNNDLRRQHYTDKPGISIGSNCKVDADCGQLGNAICEPSGTCVCKRAHFFIEDLGKCVPELGEPCRSEDRVNIDYSECRNGKWHCELDRAVAKDNRKCEKATKRYNNYCRIDLQCFVFGPDAICKDNNCVCNENSRFDETELFCWTKRGIGEVCQGDVDCYVDGINAKLSCTNNLCSCPNGTYPNSNRTSCLSTSAGIGMRCEADNDCAKEHSKCVNDVCACVDNHYESNNECVPGINATCTTNKDCSPENSECASGHCSCQEGYVAPSFTSCIPAASFGQPCEEDIQCSSTVSNAICSPGHSPITNSTTNSTCTCAEGYHYNFDKCFKRKVLGTICKNLGECYLDSGDRVVCKNGRCACDWGYIQVNDTACKPIQRYNINSSSVRTGALGLVSIALLLMKLLI